MKCFFDTNILLDVLSNREPFATDSKAALSLATTQGNTAVASVLSFWNLAYLLRKLLPETERRSALRNLSAIVHPANVSADHLFYAFDSPCPDFEDAVQMACARSCGADVVVTRDAGDYSTSPVPALSPAAFLALMRMP